MTTPSLGFEPDKAFSMPEIALIQLNEAISLFVGQRFLSALTLAGAAEEILGKLLARRGALPAIKASAAAIERLRDDTGRQIMGTASEKELIDGWNRARNITKHLIGLEDQLVTLNLCDEAYWMLCRAMANADSLGLTVLAKQDFENWVVININML